MIENSQTCARLLLSRYWYGKIEHAVSDLLIETETNTLPIDPFKIAARKGYIVTPYSLLDGGVEEVLRSSGKDGASIFDPDRNTYVIFYDNVMLEKLNPSKILCFGTPFEEMEGNIIPIDYQASRKVVR